MAAAQFKRQVLLTLKTSAQIGHSLLVACTFAILHLVLYDIKIVSRIKKLNLNSHFRVK